MIYQLTYQSNASYSPTPQDLESLLEKSRINNKEIGVTGCLVFFEKKFIQILEGQEELVKGVYKKISKDSRHQDIALIVENNTDRRLFPDWGMLFHQPQADTHSREELEQFRRNVFLLTGLLNTKTNTEFSFWNSIRNAIF